MGGTIPVATSELVGTFLETLFYGVYLVVFPQTMIILYRKKVDRASKFYFMGTMVISILLITLHLVVDLTRVFAAFTANLDVAGAPEKYYATVNTSLNLTKNASYVTVTLVGDLLILHRTFMVWGRNWWVVLLPAIIFGVDFAMSVWFTWSVHEAKPGSSVLVSSVFARSRYFFVATLALNLVCTLLIAYRIWKVASTVRSLAANNPRGPNALSIVLESAAIYTAALVCLIGTSVTFDSAMFFFLNSMPPIIGSVFSYVVLRAMTDHKRYLSTTATNTTELSSFKPYNRTKRETQAIDTGVHVHLERSVIADKASLSAGSRTDDGGDFV